MNRKGQENQDYANYGTAERRGFVQVCSILCSSLSLSCSFSSLPHPSSRYTNSLASASSYLLCFYNCLHPRSRAAVRDDATISWTCWALGPFGAESQREWVLVWVFLLTIINLVSKLFKKLKNKKTKLTAVSTQRSPPCLVPHAPPAS
jgi:hypothetical protein